jgi:hypothetical protein
LEEYIRRHNLGKIYFAPLDVVLGEPGEEQVVQPDILFVRKARRTSSVRMRFAELQT